jgi:hypothetical protein
MPLSKQCHCPSSANQCQQDKDLRKGSEWRWHWYCFGTNDCVAWDIRKRAERRLGEMMAEQPNAKAPNPKTSGFQKTRRCANPRPQGIDKNLAKRARKPAAVPALIETVRIGSRKVVRSAGAFILRQPEHSPWANLTMAS